jgi:hypothetical protein
MPVVRPMRVSILILLFALLAACADESTDATAAAGTESVPAGATTNTESDALAPVGLLFTDSDPWMAGAEIVQGTLRVGDRLYLLGSTQQRIAVIVTAIRDDATRSDVGEASAGQGVFLSFRAESAPTSVGLGADPLLVGDPAMSDHAQALQRALAVNGR